MRLKHAFAVIAIAGFSAQCRPSDSSGSEILTQIAYSDPSNLCKRRDARLVKTSSGTPTCRLVKRAQRPDGYGILEFTGQQVRLAPSKFYCHNSRNVNVFPTGTAGRTPPNGFVSEEGKENGHILDYGEDPSTRESWGGAPFCFISKQDFPNVIAEENVTQTQGRRGTAPSNGPCPTRVVCQMVQGACQNSTLYYAILRGTPVNAPGKTIPVGKGILVSMQEEIPGSSPVVWRVRISESANSLAKGKVGYMYASHLAEADGCY